MTRTERQKPTTTYDKRDRPSKYISRLRDENNIVCNEDWYVIYIFANTWKELATQWATRQKPLLNN